MADRRRCNVLPLWGEPLGKPKKKSSDAENEIYVPRRRAHQGSRTGRGISVQTFLDPATKQRFDEYLRRHRGITVQDCLRWLITYAIAHDLEPPSDE